MTVIERQKDIWVENKLTFIIRIRSLTHRGCKLPTMRAKLSRHESQFSVVGISQVIESAMISSPSLAPHKNQLHQVE